MGSKGSKTEQNLLKAFAARARRATATPISRTRHKRRVFEQIAAIFEETAGNEREHAQVFFGHLEGDGRDHGDVSRGQDRHHR